ncbi:MAG: hypothetical protein BWY85_00173 [Firmicutes bacterium ADurb.Bin506]|nr:MAG: hypothetical protein BWY85_00173 [Firmicutes bacterium ADurb.Bin506]
MAMLTGVRFGFGEHGHLVGKPAMIGVFNPYGLGVEPDEVVSPATPGDLFILMVLERTLLTRPAEDLVSLYRALSAIGWKVHVCVRPLVPLRDSAMAYDAVLRVIDADDFDRPPNCDDRYSSVSVHCWPGSGVMEHLSKLKAEQGRYLVLTGEDFGLAKVWLQHAPERSAWTLARDYPFNDTMEAPEIEELYVRGSA